MAKQLLKDVTIRNAKPAEKDYRLSDGEGLCVLIKTTGAKWWRFDYSFEGKRKTLSVGVYPEVGIAAARDRAEKARESVANGIDPSSIRKEVKAAKEKVVENEKRIDAGLPVVGSFGHVAMEFFDKKMTNRTKQHRDKTWRSIEVNLFPHIKNRPIHEIEAPELLEVIRRVEYRAVTMAHRLIQVSGQIFRYGVASGYCKSDITQSLKGALKTHDKEHFSAVTDTKRLGDLLRAIEACSGSFTVKSALKLAPIVFVRPGELRRMEWQDVDLDAAEWRYMVTKTKTPHIVPLPRQAVEILKSLYPLTGGNRYVFQSEKANSKTGYISDRSLLFALRRMGFDSEEVTMHGFRATARTILDEQLGFRIDFVEHQLAHAVRDPNGRAYNRTAHLSERQRMMQAWADYLDGLKAGAQVIPFRKIG